MSRGRVFNVRVVAPPADGADEPGSTRRRIQWNDQTLDATLRELDPVVVVRGHEVKWEVALRLANGKTFHGYGMTPDDAWFGARDAVTSAGELPNVMWSAVTNAFMMSMRR